MINSQEDEDQEHVLGVSEENISGRKECQMLLEMMNKARAVFARQAWQDGAFGYVPRAVLVEWWAGAGSNGQMSQWELVRKGDNECRVLIIPVHP